MENSQQNKRYDPNSKQKKSTTGMGAVKKKYSSPQSEDGTKIHPNKNYKKRSDSPKQPQESNKKYYNNKQSNNRYNSEKSSYKKTESPAELVIFAHCKICSAGISNEAYAIKIGEEEYVHFECILKKVKEIGQKKFSYGAKLKYTYIGSNTFAIYLEQGGNHYIWKILQKVKVEEILPAQPKNTIIEKN